MRAFIYVPILKPNIPQGAFLVNCGPDTYPAGTQTHAWLDARDVIGIVPIGTDNIPAREFVGGCRILLTHGHSLMTTMSADDVRALVVDAS